MSDVTTEAADPGEIAGATMGFAIVAVLLVFFAGLFVVDSINTLESDGDCGTYGYSDGPGGYGCGPNLEDATLELTQTVDLVDGQIIGVRGENFDPHNASWGVAQCDAAVVETLSLDDCSLSTASISNSGPDGSAQTTIRVRRILRLGGAEIDCAVAGACVVGAATLGSGFLVPVESAVVPIQFDPDVDPLPVPAATIVVGEISASSIAVTIECSNATSIYVDAELQQEIDGTFGYAYGYVNDTGIDCAAGPFEWEIPLMSGQRRIGRGDATWYVYVSVSNELESGYANESGEVRITRTPRVTYVTSEQPGVASAVQIRGVVGTGADQAMRVVVMCDRDAEQVQLSVNVFQWAGLDRIDGSGYTALEGCAGRQVVDVPFDAYNGRLVGGAAQAEVYLSLYDIDESVPEPPFGYFYDYATASKRVQLHGHDAAPLTYGEPNPDSRITIGEVTAESVSGVIECEEPTTVQVSAQARQYDGRLLADDYAWTTVDLECDGETDFALDWQQGLRRFRRAGVDVSAYAYEIVQFGEFEQYVYLWNDQQSAEVRVRR